MRPECWLWGMCESGSGDLAGELSQALSLPWLCHAALGFITWPVFSLGYTAVSVCGKYLRGLTLL